MEPDTKKPGKKVKKCESKELYALHFESRILQEEINHNLKNRPKRPTVEEDGYASLKIMMI